MPRGGRRLGAGEKPGTNPKGPWTAHHRDKIRKSKVLNTLISQAEGGNVTAGLGLLPYAYPKLQPIDEETGKSGITITLAKHVEDL